MAHDAFISYSTKDKATADAVCATLEGKGIRCWIAPRDVVPGTNWAGAIVDAIHHSQILVLVFSANSNASPQVMQEVERAASSGLPILPFRIEDIVPSDAMGYFLGSRHWLDAMTPPMERHLQQLASTVRVVLDQFASAAQGSDHPQTAAAPPIPPAYLPATPARRSMADRLRLLVGTPYRAIALAALLAAIAVAAVLGVHHSASAASLTSAQLYNALLESPLNEGSLPSGFSSPQAPFAVDGGVPAQDRPPRALGEVQLDLTGPDWRNSTSFVLFSGDADAHAGFDRLDGSVTPSGFNLPAKCASGSATLDTLAYGFTRCAALSSNVYVMSESIVLGDGQKQGSAASATTLLHLGVTQLQKVRSSPPRPLSSAVPPQPPPSPSPLTQLPLTVTVIGEDAGAQPKIAEVQGDLRTILANFEAQFGLTENRRWTVHLFTDPVIARQQMSKLGVSDSDINDMFTAKDGVRDQFSGDSMDSILYLPDLEDLRGELGFLTVSYLLRNNGGLELDGVDVYPWWFISGLGDYEQAISSQTGFGYHARAVADAKAGLAPSLDSVVTGKSADQFMTTQPGGAATLAARGAATVEYISQHYGYAALGSLVKDNALGSIDKFNGLLKSLTNLTVAALDSTVGASLHGGGAAAKAQCDGWSGSWNSSFGPMQIAISGNALTGTYTLNGGQGRLNGTASGNVATGTWAEPPTFQAPQHAGDFQFTLASGGNQFTGQWRYGSTGDWSPNWSGRCTGNS